MKRRNFLQMAMGLILAPEIILDIKTKESCINKVEKNLNTRFVFTLPKVMQERLITPFEVCKHSHIGYYTDNGYTGFINFKGDI